MSETAAVSNTLIEDDEMPVAPPAEGSTDTSAASEVEIDGSMEADIVEKATSFGENLPAGTYHFRLKRYTQGGWPNDDGLGPDPVFNLQWECLDPRFNGRIFFDRIKWVRSVDRERAKMGDQDYITKCNSRLGDIKDLQKAAGFNPKGKYDVKADFLDKSPEVKIQIKEQTKRAKNEVTGVWGPAPSGETENKRVKFYPVMRS